MEQLQCSSSRISESITRYLIRKNIKSDGSAWITETVNSQATDNNNGVNAKANYEEAYDIKSHAKFGNKDVDSRAKFSDNIYGVLQHNLKTVNLKPKKKLEKK